MNDERERIETCNSTNGVNNANDEHLPQVPPQSSRDRSTGGVLARILFQRLLIFSLVRLIIYLNKIYQDFHAVDEYYNDNDFNYCIISIAAIVAPPLIYTVYLTGANLAKDDIINKSEISTRAVNGVLLVPWQIKRHLDVLHYTAQKACQWRTPVEQEKEDIKTLERNAEILEFFEDFYSGFLQLVMQIYILFGKNLFGSGDHEFQNTKVLYWQLFGSALSISSMMIASRRRDDGPLTGVLSFLGWSCIFVSRVVVFSLVATYIHFWLFILCLIHVLVFSLWIYNIAIESYHISSSSTSVTNAQWTSTRRRASIAILVFLFFGVPSLVFWPIMFQLKECKRPLIFLLVITVENIFLLLIWGVFHVSYVGSQLSEYQMLMVSMIVIATLGGTFFLMMYVFCKPKYTDQVVLYKIRETRNQEAPTLIKMKGDSSRMINATHYGIYYEFCDLVFKLPPTHKIGSALEEIHRNQAETGAQ
ncbi:hypothetical protein B4U80_04274 [Leptotrombidium deliense]|uniref:XK-related protein n=1 Tax=Leptotrombidium deliense TaxID=299467 RepID=A0A443SEF2_9ACAR|nr:hypothetical protein B4U80_04274 [Leptotrombidium deliense]